MYRTWKFSFLHKPVVVKLHVGSFQCRWIVRSNIEQTLNNSEDMT